MTGGYDQLYQQWLEARRSKDYDKADSIRTEFERLHCLTIFAEGDMPIEDVTVRRMKKSTWHKLYGNPEVGLAIERQDSYIKSLYPGYQGLK